MTCNAPYFKMYRNTCFHISFSYDYFIYSLTYLLLMSHFSLALVLYLFQFIWKGSCSKYVWLNVKNKFEKVVGSAVLVTLKASDRYSLSLAFQFWHFYLGFKICQSYIILWRLSWWTKHVSFMNYDWTQSLFFCHNPKAYGKILLPFCRGNQFHGNSRSAYKVTS